MDKLTMAHEFAIKYGSCDNFALTVAGAWEYADAMQAEADKRKQEEDEKWRNELKLKTEAYMNCEISVFGANGECKITTRQKEQDEKDWQPDWSQAPDSRVNYWSKESNGTATWWIGEPTRNTKKGTHHDNDDCACFDDAPTFNYQGDWKHSLRKRP